MKNRKCIELFAGAGGLALGLEQAGFEEVALIEIDKTACETLKLNRPKWNVLKERMVVPLLIDGRNLYDHNEVISNGIIYMSIGS